MLSRLSRLSRVNCYKYNYICKQKKILRIELGLIAVLSACFGMSTNIHAQSNLNNPAITTAPTATAPVASAAGMIELPPVPDVAINQDKFSGYLDHVDEVTKIEQKQQALKDLIPWRGKVGDPKDPNFQALLKQQFPMSPEQIKVFRDTLNIYEQALQAQSRNPTPSMSTRSVDLDPGSAPPPVRISTGYVSTLIFLDETGAPWPIKAYDIGNASAFNVYWDKESNFMMLQGLVPYANTNIVVLLHNLETPVILNLINDQQKVDYRLDLRIPGLGPKATTPMIRSNIPSTDNILISLIDGIPPERARPLQVNGGAASVWIIDDSELLIRTRLTILSPSYTSSMRSADGMKVYRMPKTPVIMASKDGNTYQLAIDGY
jgi:intracellular multiplication protein IcmK